MNKIYPFIFLITIFTLVSCSSNEPAYNTSENINDDFSAYQKIIRRANLYYSQLKGNTRAAVPRVTNIETVSNGKTRNEADDSVPAPIYYIVNYENKEGFVIVGGNETADPVVGLSDEGNLSLNDTLNNPGLAAFIRSLQNQLSL